MKLKFLYIALALFGATTLTSCDDDKSNDPSTNTAGVPEAVTKSFETSFPVAQYPEAKNAEWEKKGEYFTAEFSKFYGQVEVTAWFKADGTLAMTNNDYGRDLFMIPAPVNVTFEKTEYAKTPWDSTDIDEYLFADDSATYYVIEVEANGKPDMLLFFKADGTLIKTVPEAGIEITPNYNPETAN